MIKKLLILLALSSNSLYAACLVNSEIEQLPIHSAVLDNPILQVANMKYEGAFLLSSWEFGSSTLHDAEGGMAYAPPKPSSPNGSIFAVGNSVRPGVSEWAIPQLVNTTDVNELNMSEKPLQTFVDLTGRATDRQRGMGHFSDLLWVDNQLLYSEHRYYPASILDLHKMGVLRNADNLEASPVEGYFQINALSGEEGSSSYTASSSSGWLSTVPDEWQTVLGGTHLLGPADGWSIAGRFAAGPSVFAFNAKTEILAKVPDAVVASTPLIDYATENPIDMLGEAGEGLVNAPSDLWNSMSFVHFGFIPPGSRTLMLVGNHWGMDGDIGYKITQENGNLCGGPCTFDQDDGHNYYWLIDLSDVADAKAGKRRYDSIIPYAYGPLNLPFQLDKNGNPKKNAVVGGAFDADTGTVYLQVRSGDPRPTYAVAPVMLAYKFDTSVEYLPPMSPKWIMVAGEIPSSDSAPEFKLTESSDVEVQWQIPTIDTAGNPITVDHYRLHYENMDLSYSNNKRNQRIGVTVEGIETKHKQQLSPGNWKATIRAISADGTPSRL